MMLLLTRALKRTLARCAPATSAVGVRILLYHAVEEPDPCDRLALRLAPELFRAQMHWLNTEGYQVVPLTSLRSEDGVGEEHRVIITFDDGYASQLQAADILEEFGFPATFFVVGRFLNGEFDPRQAWERWPHFGWAEARRLAERGFEIGAHSRSHARLTGCSPAQLHDEAAGAKGQLEERLGQAVVSFSYPHGAYNAAVERAVQEAGYHLACTSVCGANRPPWKRFELRRTEITGADGLPEFRRKLEGRYDWLEPWHEGRARDAHG